MELPNDIVLRPRFSLELATAPETLLDVFDQEGKLSSKFIVSRIDDHVFICIPKKQQHFWSPQLHLEIYKRENQPTVLKGLYGPSPTVWTLFIFLHFMVATLFAAAGIWLYTSVSLESGLIIPLMSMIILVILWFALYFAGRLGKKAGEKEMRALQTYMYETLNTLV